MISGIWILLKLYLSNHKQHQNCEIELIHNDLIKIYPIMISKLQGLVQSPKVPSQCPALWWVDCDNQIIIVPRILADQSQ